MKLKLSRPSPKLEHKIEVKRERGRRCVLYFYSSKDQRECDYFCEIHDDGLVYFYRRLKDERAVACSVTALHRSFLLAIAKELQA